MKAGKAKLAVLMGAAAIVMAVPFTPSATLSAEAAVQSEEYGVQPLSDDIQWVYKVENGKIYKRLYNYSTANWVGNWIYVGVKPTN